MHDALSRFRYSTGYVFYFSLDFLGQIRVVVLIKSRQEVDQKVVLK